MNAWRAVQLLGLACFSFGWQVLSPFVACDFLSRLQGLYHAVIPPGILQVHTCVAALHGFDPTYVLRLPDGSNCSGVWGLRSAAFDACVGTPFWDQPPHSYGCFYFALSTGDPASFISYDACLELRNQGTNDSEPMAERWDGMGALLPKQAFQDPDITFWEEVVCLNEVLYLPTDNAKIVVAALTYEQVLREMKHLREIL